MNYPPAEDGWASRKELETGDIINTEISMFLDFFKNDIVRIKTAYGFGSCQAKWGIIYYYY